MSHHEIDEPLDDPHSKHFQNICKSVKALSLYELHHLVQLIWHELEDPTRLKEAKSRVKIGDKLEWFNNHTNTTQVVEILEKHRKTVKARDEIQRRLWSLPYYVLNLSNVSATLPLVKGQRLSRQHFSLGEAVGFNHQELTLYGHITKLNPKMAVVKTTCERTWRVRYGALIKVIDSELTHDNLLIEGEVVR